MSACSSALMVVVDACMDVLLATMMQCYIAAMFVAMTIKSRVLTSAAVLRAAALLCKKIFIRHVYRNKDRNRSLAKYLYVTFQSYNSSACMRVKMTTRGAI